MVSITIPETTPRDQLTNRSLATSVQQTQVTGRKHVLRQKVMQETERSGSRSDDPNSSIIATNVPMIPIQPKLLDTTVSKQRNTVIGKRTGVAYPPKKRIYLKNLNNPNNVPTSAGISDNDPMTPYSA